MSLPTIPLLGAGGGPGGYSDDIDSILGSMFSLLAQAEADPTGEADSRAAIANADGAGPVFFSAGTWRVSADLTISNYCHFWPGAKLKPDSGVTITLAGGLNHTLNWQVFDVSAGGQIAFDPAGVRPPHSLAEWWGVTGTDDQVPIQHALDVWPSFTGDDREAPDDTAGGTCLLLGRRYNTSAPPVVGAYQELLGSGPSTVINSSSTTKPAIDMTNVVTTVATASNGVNTSTFAGSGTLHVADASIATRLPASGKIYVDTAGDVATITYTGISISDSDPRFTGCTTTSGGGALATGGAAFLPNIRSNVDNLTVRGPSVQGDGGYGIRARLLWRSTIGSRIWIWGAADSGIHVEGASYSYIGGGTPGSFYVQQCRGYGVRLRSMSSVNPDFFVTATWVMGAIVRSNYYAGVVYSGTSGCFLLDSTLEANGGNTESIGVGASLSGPRSFNAILDNCSNTLVAGGYMEQAGSYTNPTQIGVTGGDGTNLVKDVGLHNYVGLYLFSAVDGTVSGETFKDLRFNAGYNPNVLTEKDPAAGATRPNGNYFLENIGMNPQDSVGGDGSHTFAASNTVVGPGSLDGLTGRTQVVTTGSNYTPDNTPLTAAGLASGLRKGQQHEVTVTAGITILNPTNFQEGERLTITIIQDGTGGRAIAWDTAFKLSWSNTGNTANKRSTIVFVRNAAGNFVQEGAQSPWF
jgi:hypothetical protein